MTTIMAPQTVYQNKTIQVPVQREVNVPVEYVETVPFTYEVLQTTYETKTIQVPTTVMVPQTTYQTISVPQQTMQTHTDFQQVHVKVPTTIMVPKATYETQTISIPKQTIETRTGYQQVPCIKKEIKMQTSYETQTVQEAVQIMVPQAQRRVETQGREISILTTPHVATTQTVAKPTPNHRLVNRLDFPVIRRMEEPGTAERLTYREAKTLGYRGDASAGQGGGYLSERLTSREAQTSGYMSDASAVLRSPDYYPPTNPRGELLPRNRERLYVGAPTYNTAPNYSYNPNTQYQSYQGGGFQGGGQGGAYLSSDGRMYSSSQSQGETDDTHTHTHTHTHIRRRRVSAIHVYKMHR
jgi:hypothetical protein